MTIRTPAIPLRGVPAPRSDEDLRTPSDGAPTSLLQRLIEAHGEHAAGRLSVGDLERRTAEILAAL